MFLSLLGIRIPNPDEVQHYFVLHPDMIDSVRAMCKAAIEEFGDKDELSLEVFRDPESDDKYLTLYIRQHVYDEDILDRIERVSERFDEDATERSGWFLMTTDFQSPKQ